VKMHRQRQPPTLPHRQATSPEFGKGQQKPWEQCKVPPRDDDKPLASPFPIDPRGLIGALPDDQLTLGRRN
jgi:hypothetical protein